MNVVRWDPFRDLMTIQDRVQRLLSDQAVRQNGEEGYGAWVPPVDIFQDQDNLVLRAEVPGVDKDNIDVRVENGVLSLQGERMADTDLDDKNTFRRERIFGRFARSFTLPTMVDATRITARYRDGVLEIVLPKAEAAKPKRVEIQVA
jgi:HSP20 family protein